MFSRSKLLRFVLRDWSSLSAGALTLLGISLCVFGLAISWTSCVAVAALLCAACTGWAVWRIRWISRLLVAGPRLSGRVVRRRDLGHALVTYAFGNRVYESTIAINGPPNFDPRRGDDVAIIIDPRQPTRAFFLQALAD